MERQLRGFPLPPMEAFHQHAVLPLYHILLKKYTFCRALYENKHIFLNSTKFANRPTTFIQK